MHKLELICIFKEKSFGIMFAIHFCRNELSSLCGCEQLMQTCFGEFTFNSTHVQLNSAERDFDMAYFVQLAHKCIT